MTGAEAWSLVQPMIYLQSNKNFPESYDAMMEAYVLVHIGLTLFDSWVKHGKPDEWRLKNE